MNYLSLSPEQLEDELERVKKEYEAKRSLGLKLDMSRGRPSKLQSDLTEALLTAVSANEDCISDDGVDCRNYGFPKGIMELRRIFAPIMGADPENVAACGNSTLNLMYDCLCDAMLFGYPESPRPWGREDKVKFICPVPGYDRHFGVTEALGIEMVNVDMTPDGPDMDAVEELVKDPAVKGIWCVPRYSNPDGYVYSDCTVDRLASMKCAAPDFRIFWDNAYAIHDLYDDGKPLKNILEAAAKAGNPDRPLVFFSTSKITYAGAGVGFFAGSKNSVDNFMKRVGVRTIGYDKLNQLRHARYFRSTQAVLDHMKKHAELLRPKFETVCDVLEKELGHTGTARWNKPRGGYFVGLNVMEGTAAETYRLAKEAGVTLTKVGATYPYGRDPHDSSIRISPSAVTEDELRAAIGILCVCARLAALDKLISDGKNS